MLKWGGVGCPGVNSHKRALKANYPQGWQWISLAKRIPGWLTDGEANSLFEIARNETPERDVVIVELGSWQGKSSALLAAGLCGKPGARLFCVDPFGDDESPEYRPTMRLGIEEAFHRNMRRAGVAHIVHPIKGYSHHTAPSWREPIDVLFIDANHDYECVRRDFELWSPFVKPGGIVAMHDVSPVWPGPSRVMLEELQPPLYGDLRQVDSLVWARRSAQLPEAMPNAAERVVAAVPRTDYLARLDAIEHLRQEKAVLEMELHRLIQGRAELEDNFQRQSGKYAELESNFQRQSGEYAELEKQFQRLLGQHRELETEFRRLFQERGELATELLHLRPEHAELVAEFDEVVSGLERSLAASRQQLASLRDSWSWRLTSPLRVLLDSSRMLYQVLRSGFGLLRPARYRCLMQWFSYRKQVRASGLFDDQYYLDHNSDVARLGINPLLHYFLFGQRELRNPHPLFDARYYSESNPEVVDSGTNPLVDYLTRGAQECHEPNSWFDSRFYLEENPDVRADGFNPLVHYLTRGIVEGRDPNPWFDTSEYLDQHPHLCVCGLHYLVEQLAQSATQESHARA
jgi:hypothetical protein